MSHQIRMVTAAESVLPAPAGLVVTAQPDDEGVGDGAGADPGVLLRTWRERALLTQEQLAERAGLSVRTVRRCEGAGAEGRPQSASIRLLADALGLTRGERATLVDALGGAYPARVPGRSGAGLRSAGAVEPASAGVVPRQLPAAPPLFTGRAREVAEIERMGDPRAVSIIVIDGMPGVGKTALALEAAHRMAGRFPDGQIYVDLHGYTRGVPPVGPAEALDRVLRSLGVPGEQIPPGLDDRAALYRSRLADRQVLILLDNAPSEAHVAPLVPGTPGCLVMITSRRRLNGLDHTHVLSLDLLPMADAVDLLALAAGEDGLHGEQRLLLAETAELCARLPLALRIAAARLRSRPSWTVAHLAERLRDHRLAELEAGQRSVTAALDLSYAQLAPEQQRAYRMLGLHPGSDFDLAAAAALGGASSARTALLLDHLLDAHLLQEPGPGRYRLHDLVRSHAANLGRADADGADQRAALARLLDHYCRTAAAADETAYPYERGDQRPAAVDPGDARRAGEWLDTELANLLAAARYAADHGSFDHVADMSTALRRHLRTRGRYEDAATLHELALATAQHDGDRTAELGTLTALGHIRRLQGRHAAAIELFAAAAHLARSLGDQDGEVDVLTGTGHAHRLQSRYWPAADCFGRALRIARRTGRRRQELEALFGLGWVHLAQGHAAPDTFARAVQIARTTGHSPGRLRALVGLGHSHRILRRHERAEENFADALRLARTIGERSGEIDALTGLAALHRQIGRYDRAMAGYREALDLARRIESPACQFEALHGTGRVLHAMGKPHEALTRLGQALDLAAEAGQAAEQARAHDALANAHQALGRQEDARQHWRRALSILAALGTASTEDTETTAPAIRARLARLDRAASTITA